MHSCYFLLRFAQSTCGLVLVLVLSLPSTASAERLQITVGGADFRPLPIAAPAPIITDGAKETQLKGARTFVAELLAADVTAVRAFTWVSAELPPFPTNSEDMPNVEYFRNIGVSGLVWSTLTANTDSITLTLQFYATNDPRPILQKTCQQSQAQLLTPCVHEFFDKLLRQITGETGFFSSRIAFVRQNGKDKHIYTCAPDGYLLQQITSQPGMHLMPSWHPSDRSIFFSSYAKGPLDLYHIITGGSARAIVTTRGDKTGVSVSPNGTTIAYSLLRDGNPEIYISDISGQNPRRITHSPGIDISPTWSPDGKHIAFISNRSGQPHVYVMDADGRHVTRITFAGTYNQEPHWSPRPGGGIVFTARDEHYKYDLFHVDPNTHKITRLTQGTGHNHSPSFSPDGHAIVFTSTRNSTNPRTRRLWMMDADGKRPRPIATPEGDIETPKWSLAGHHP